MPACPPETRSPKLPVQRQLWVRGCGLVWWLSRICCTSCSTEKPELLFPLLQVHLMPWTEGERQGGQRPGLREAGAGEGGALAHPEQRSFSAGRPQMSVRREAGGPGCPPQTPLPWGALCSPSLPWGVVWGVDRLVICFCLPQVQVHQGSSSKGPGVEEKGARTGEKR